MTNRKSGKVVFLDRSEPTDTDTLLEKVAYDHEPALRRFLRMRLVGHPDYEDLVQDVFIRLASQDDLVSRLSRGEASTRSYLFSIAANLVNDRHRKQAIRSSHDERMSAEPAARRVDVSAEELASQQEDLRSVRRALIKLPEDTRDAFVLSRFEAMSYREIADRLEISVSMVQEHIVRALRVLRKKVDTSY